MTKTVDELRNEIRVLTDRFEREISATFTKEDLAAICETVGYDIDPEPLPPKPQMRAGILSEVSFFKRELEKKEKAIHTLKTVESIDLILDYSSAARMTV